MTGLYLKSSNKRLDGATVLVRVDFNVPLGPNGDILSKERISRGCQTLRYILRRGGQPIILTHLGRPKEGYFDAKYSTKILESAISEELGVAVLHYSGLDRGWEGQSVNNTPILLENSRFNNGEGINDSALGARYSSLADIFVMDAFAVSHRKAASTVSVAEHAKERYLGLLVEEELSALGKIWGEDQQNKYKAAVLGGGKISTKLPMISNLSGKVDRILVAGAILNTFLLANGVEVGISLVDLDYLTHAKELLPSVDIRWVTDVLVEDGSGRPVRRALGNIKRDDSILDLGPESVKNMAAILDETSVILWNGPLGMIEKEEFSTGTKMFLEYISQYKGFSIAGGGETIEAIGRLAGPSPFGYVSTGGGSFLAYLSGESMPALETFKLVAKGGPSV